jgi:formylglycine-generating enzyme
MPRLCSSLLLSLWIASSASAVTLDWTFVGYAGNPADTQVMDDGTTSYGSVPYAYNVGTYEVTNAQYAEFLNAKAAVADPYEIYDPQMSEGGGYGYGGIQRTGSPGNYTYSTFPGQYGFPGSESKPVTYITFYDALRFANWMNNGQGNGDTETGTYTLLGGTPTPSNGTTVTRNPGATIALPTEDEWYKAAYYDALSASYLEYPAGSNAPTTCAQPGPAPNSANCDALNGPRNPTIVGGYTGSRSPVGTYDQGGNVLEWSETIVSSGDRIVRGGSYESYNADTLSASLRAHTSLTGNAAYTYLDEGIRLVMIPEPSTGLLVFAGLLGLAGQRRRLSKIVDIPAD